MIKSDWKRGASESRQQIESLRARWPKAFPVKGTEVRPLTNVAPAIAEAFGWSNAYTRGVLNPWVMRQAYCRALLIHTMRINLDGSESELTVEDRARAIATARLAQLADRKAQEPQRKAQEPQRKAQEPQRKAQEPQRKAQEAEHKAQEAEHKAQEAEHKARAAAAKPPPAPLPEPAPPVAPEPVPEPPRARKILTLGASAKEALLKRDLGTTEVVATIQRRAR